VKYRDDRAAMRQRAQNLEDQLAEASSKLQEAQARLSQQQQKDEQEERQLAQLQSEVAHLRGRLGLPTVQPARNTRVRIVLFFSLATMLLGGAFGFFLVAASDEPDQQVGVAHPPAEVTVVSPPTPAIPGATAASPKPSELALFGAEVIAESGGKVNVGDGCVLRVKLQVGLQLGNVDVRCGQTVLYRSTDPRGSGTNALNREIRELPAFEENSWRYALNYVDRGPHSGSRAQIIAKTQTHRARVYREGAVNWSVSLHISDVSFPRWGKPLDSKSVPTTLPRPLHAIAKVTERKGPVPDTVKEPCELYLRPSSDLSGPNCRLMLRCGGNIIYGAESSGYASCEADETFISAVDDKRSSADNDPAIAFDWRKRKIRVEDDGPGELWSVTFALDDKPSCGFEGAWIGEGIDEGGAPWSFAWNAQGAAIEMKWKGPGSSGIEKAERDGACTHDRLQIQGKEVDTKALVPTRYVIEMGPGWQSFGGRWFTGRPGALAGVRRR
jgi:hypothetical protein